MEQILKNEIKYKPPFIEKVYTKEEIKRMDAEIYWARERNRTTFKTYLKNLSNFNPRSRSHYHIMVEFPKQ